MESEQEQPKRPKGVLLLSSDGDCLSDIDVYKFYRYEGHKRVIKVPTKEATVETRYNNGFVVEQSQIKVAPVKVLTENGIQQVMADVITGTLYHKDGTCLSSSNRRVIKWHK